MRLESKKYLFDVLQAARNLQRFSEGKTFPQYEADGYFTGSLADFSIHSRALSAGEVSYLAGAR